MIRSEPSASDPILVVAPTDVDERITRTLLEEAGLRGIFFASAAALSERIDDEAGALLLTDEALLSPGADALAEALARQPAWSDLASVVLCRQGSESKAAAWTLERLSGAMILERPARKTTLVSVLRTALQARRRQRQVRDQMERLREATEAMRASEERFRLSIEASPAPVAMVDQNGRIAMANDALLTLSGYPSDELLGLPAETLVPEARRMRHARQREAYMREPLARRMAPGRELVLRRRDGEMVDVEIELSPTFKVDDGVFVLAVVNDVTERKEAERALRRSHEDLERRVAERTGELRARAEQLSRLTSQLTLAEQRERQRLGRVLHDHLQQLLASAKIGLDSMAGADERRRKQWREHIGACIQEAIAAARSLSVELAPPILHEGGLRAGFEWLARWMREKHGLEVSLSLDREADPVREDIRTLIFELARELLFNVVKHAGVRRASLEMAREGDESLRVTVSDEGAGFGLLTIRERLTLLGGRFEIDSAPGRGARFTLVAPRGATDETEAGEAEGARAGDDAASSGDSLSRRLTVRDGVIRLLIVDDHAVMREGLCSLLAEQEGLEVVGEASDGIEAIEQVRALHPDVVLMDFSLPRLNGVETTRRLVREHPDVKVIGLSMYARGERADAMLEAGAAAYLTKSGDADELMETIRRVHAGRPIEAAERER